MGRFINSDAQFDGNAGFAGYNLFSYCANSPIAYKDTSGFAIETALDIASVILSFLELIGKPSWTAAGYLVWDVAAAIIPFIPASYIAKGFKIASKIDDFIEGCQLLTGSYKTLKKIVKGIKGIEIHHLVEKRFASLFSCDANQFLSVALTPEMHQIITNRWRNLHTTDSMFKNFAYGSDYTKITYVQMIEAVKAVYYDMPAVLDDILDWVKKNWRDNHVEKILE